MHKGLFQYNRLPYEISASLSIFQKLMDSTLAKKEQLCIWTMDDILVTGTSKI